MKSLNLALLTLAIAVLSNCTEKPEEISEFRHFESIKREFSISQTSNQTGLGDTLQSKVMQASPDDAELWKKLENERNSLAPIFLIYLAEHVIVTNERKAIEWYWLGLIRTQLDLSLCADQTAQSGIGFVASLAPNVLNAMRQDQERAATIARKVLNRSDLRISRASPWWICSHGARSLTNSLQKHLAAKMTDDEAQAIGVDKQALQNAGREQWLIPEDQMAQRYNDVISGYNKTFSQMLAAFQDPIKISSEPLLPVPVIDNQAVDEFFWLNDTTLAILKGGRENEVYVYNIEGEASSLIKRGFPMEFCASHERILVNSNDLEMTQFKKAWRQSFTSWSIKNGHITPESNITLSFSNVPTYARMQAGVGSLNSNGSERHKLSRISCRWLDESALGQAPRKVNNWTDLTPFPGYLFTYQGDSQLEKGTYYLGKPNSDPIQISENLLPLDCMRYIRHQGAFLANACVTSNSDKLLGLYGWDSTNMLWLEFQHGKLQFTATKTTRHPSLKSATQAIPAATGVIRLVRSYDTPGGPRPGGLYREKKDGTLEKIWKGWIEKAELSPDGCSIAFTANYRATRNVYTGEKNKLYTANLCEYADQIAK